MTYVSWITEEVDMRVMFLILRQVESENIAHCQLI